MKEHCKLKNILLIMLMAIVAVTGACIFRPHSTYGIDSGLYIIKDDATIVSAMGDFNGGNITSEESLDKFIKDNAKSLEIKSIKELNLVATHDSAFGKVYRMQQYCDGIKVHARQMNIAVDKLGAPLNISGNYLPNIKPINAIKLTVDDIRLKLNGHEIYNIELIVYTLSGTVCYAYMTESSIDGGTTRVYDAYSGKLIERIKSNANIFTEQTNAKGQKVNIDVEETSDKYYLTDRLRNIAVYDYSQRDSRGSPIVAWTAGEQLSDEIAVSVYDYLAQIYDFYKNVDNIGVSRMGINNDHDDIRGNQEQRQEYNLVVHIHFYPNGETANYQNAYYLDEPQQNAGTIAVGDGKNGGLYQLGKSFDVLSHEYQHGITSRTANLKYINQSGAIDEAISDIFAAIMGDDPLDNDNAWLIGEDIMSNGKKALRDMKDPESLGCPSKYNGKNYWEECNKLHNHADAACDNGGVHVNSSIINNVAYNFYQSDTQYFTKQRLATLWYNTLLSLPSNCSFKILRTNILQTAKNLGYSDKHIASIAMAFDNANISGYATISFNNNNPNIVGTLPNKIDCTTQKKFKLPSSDLAQEGHTLIGWGEKNSNGEFAKIYYFDNDYDVPKANITLYPVMAVSAMNVDEQLVDILGQGSIESPYIISTPQELMSLAYYINNYDILEEIPMKNFRRASGSLGNFELGADIDMRQISGYFVPINLKNQDRTIFLDGRGYSITGIDILADSSQVVANKTTVGMFNSLYGRVTRLGLDIKITTNDNKQRIVGALAGTSNAEVSIVNANVDINVLGGGNQKVVVGGLIGNSNGIVLDCATSGAVVANCLLSIVGGIVGNSLENIISVNMASDDQGTINGRANHTVVANSVMSATLSGNVVGGVVGELSVGKIVNVLSMGNITAVNYGGGVIGRVTDWWQESDKSLSVNIAMNVISADINIIGVHALGEIKAATRGSMVGQYDKQGYSVVLDNVYSSNISYPIIGTQNTDIVLGKVSSADDINYSQESIYTSNQYFSTASQGITFAMGTLWTMTNGELKLNIGVNTWIEHATTTSLRGNGTEFSPMNVSNANDLAQVAKSFNEGTFAGKDKVYIKQTGNIDLSGKIWHSIGVDIGKKNVDRNANIHYDGNGYSITGMLAREHNFVLMDKGIMTNARAYASLLHGKSAVAEKVNIIDCNNSGSMAAGIAVQAVKISFCSVSGEISALLDSGGAAVGVDEILHTNVNATIGGASVGGLSNRISMNMIGNYVKADIIAAEGTAFRQNSVGGLLAMTVAGTSAGLVNIANNYADVKIKSMARIGNYGGAIGTVTDGANASFTLQKNVIKCSINSIYNDGTYSSMGALVGGGNMFSKVEVGVVFTPKIMDNIILSNINTIGNRTDIDIKSGLNDVKTDKFDYEKAIDKQLLAAVINNKMALTLLSAKVDGGNVAYIVKDGKVIDIVQLVDGKLSYESKWEIPQGKEFKYWRILGHDADIATQVFEKDIFVEQMIVDIEPEQADCLPEESTPRLVEKTTLNKLIIIFSCVGVIALLVVTIIIVKRKKR